MIAKIYIFKGFGIKNILKSFIVATIVVIGYSEAKAQNAGYVTGDFHQHTTYTDGSYSFAHMMTKNNMFGLDWWANSEHGGPFSKDGSHSGIDLDTTIYWDSYIPNPIIGKVNISGGHQNMWRWQSIRDYSFQEVLIARPVYPSKFIFQSYEMNVPGHEHGSLGLINNQFDSSPNCNPLAEFEFKFDNNDADSIGGLSQGWLKSILSGNAKAVEAVTWLQQNYPSTSYLIAAHPERKSLNNIQGFRDMNNAGPDVCFGFESMPGHQKAAERGEYKKSYNTVAVTTYGGCGVYAAKIGGLWDALLSEGRHWWLFANSDFHEEGNDFYPGEYQKNYTYVKDKNNPQSYVEGLRSGNNYVVEGDLIDSLYFTAADSVTMGGKLYINNHEATLKIKIHDPQGNNNNTYSSYTNPVLNHLDVIAGHVREKIQPGTPQYSIDSVTTTSVIARFDATGNLPDGNGLRSTAWTDLGNGWKQMQLTLTNINDTMYFRLRGANKELNETNETDINGNPLSDSLMAPNDASKAFSDLWFYSNPIFIAYKTNTGINDIQGSLNNIQITPNPAFDKITITNTQHNEKITIQIYDMMGRVYRHIESNQPVNTININDLPKDIYFVKIDGSNQSKTFKIVKK